MAIISCGNENLHGQLTASQAKDKAFLNHFVHKDKRQGLPFHETR